MAKLQKLWKILSTYRNWPLWFAPRLGLWMRPTVMVKLPEIELEIPNNNEGWYILDEIWLEKEYVKHFGIEDGFTVLDIGANAGVFSAFAAAAGKDVRVVSFEPSPQTFSQLAKNVEHNGLEERVTYLNCGLGSRDATVELYRPTDFPGHTSIYEDCAKDCPPSQIRRELAEIRNANLVWTYSPKYDFVKMDCEGAEYEILNTWGSRLSDIRFLTCEYHRGPEKIQEILGKYGFEILETLAIEGSTGMLHAINPSWEALTSPHFADVHSEISG